MVLHTYIPTHPLTHRQTEYLSPLSSFRPLKQTMNSSTTPGALGAAHLCHFMEWTAALRVWTQPARFVLLPGGKNKSLNKMVPFRGMIWFQFSLLIGQGARIVLHESMGAESDLWRGRLNLSIIFHLALYQMICKCCPWVFHSCAGTDLCHCINCLCLFLPWLQTGDLSPGFPDM